jgi:hypothetical protein
MCSITSVIHNTSNTLNRISDYAGFGVVPMRNMGVRGGFIQINEAV